MLKNMTRLLVAAMVGASSIPTGAAAGPIRTVPWTEESATSLIHSAQWRDEGVRDARRDLREERRDYRRALRHGDRGDIRAERRDLRRAQRQLRDERRERRYYVRDGRRYYRGPNGAEIFAGLVAGALAAGAAAATHQPPADAVAYCERRFRSYDAASGTYLGYDGDRHPCP